METATERNLFTPRTPTNEDMMIAGQVHLQSAAARHRASGLHRGIMPEVFTMAPCHSRRDCRWDEDIWKKEVLRRAGVDAHTADVADRLPRGFTSIPDRRYILRPEAIESVFVMYRLTGRAELLEAGGGVGHVHGHQHHDEHRAGQLGGRRRHGHSQGAAAGDRLDGVALDGETLKYFFTSSSVTRGWRVDGFVFSTEAHPFRRMAG